MILVSTSPGLMPFSVLCSHHVALLLHPALWPADFSKVQKRAADARLPRGSRPSNQIHRPATEQESGD